jgi:citrate lyase subunit beta/citryl-CoA lyase
MPASNLKAIDKARALDCDVVILDLEDAVAPEAKYTARAQAAAAIATGGFGAREVVVRINSFDSEWGRADLAAFADAPPDAILLPKVNLGDEIRAIAPLLPENVSVWAMIETARAMLRLEDIASAGGPLRCFVMGTNDLAKELRAPLTQTRANLHGLLAMSVAAARAFGLAILDGVYNDIDDDSGFEAQCAQAVEFGFDGKTLIHPRQVGACNRAFSPDQAAIAWAQRIVAAFDMPGNAGRGAIRVDGKMVELLHLDQAREILARGASARAAVSGT